MAIEKRSIDDEIGHVLDSMKSMSVDSKEYCIAVTNIEVLTKAKGNDRKIDANTVLVVAANLLGIILVLGYEQVHIVTSKALGFVIKGRL